MGNLTTYAGWIDVLEKFSNGDDTVISLMESESFMLDAGVAQRFYTRVEKAYRLRKEKWLSKFNQALQAQRLGQVRDLAVTVNNAKANLRPLVRFTNAEGLPADLRQVLLKDLLAFVSEIKESLTTNVPKGHPQREAMLLTLQSFGLPDSHAIVSQLPSAQSKDVSFSTCSPGRKIIF
jgi:hypothetical protein